MTSRHLDAASLTLAEAAVLLASGRGETGRQLLRAVDAQLLRRGVPNADRDDVRSDVAFALLLSKRNELLSLDAACAHVALVARNKAVDLHRRGRNEVAEDAVAERASDAPEGVLQRGLDAVSGEVHRRDVSRALVELVRELPSSERLALTATATGAGYAGSGLGRSSHYRALDRARLRLFAAVRGRVAGGLALPAVLYRTVDHLRALVLPLGATAAASIASIAFVLPAITPPTRADAHATATPRLAHATTTVARRAPVVLPAPAHLAHRRVRAQVPARARKAAPVHVVTRRIVTPSRAASSAPPPIVTTAASGLDPCRAAQLCQ